MLDGYAYSTWRIKYLTPTAPYQSPRHDASLVVIALYALHLNREMGHDTRRVLTYLTNECVGQFAMTLKKTIFHRSANFKISNLSVCDNGDMRITY